jgi:hypothetical protein
MNLFRSEEHARRWDRFTRDTVDTLRPVADWADVFANPYFRRRARGDFISWARSADGVAAFDEVRRRASG